jgi:hypothetical protein
MDHLAPCKVLLLIYNDGSAGPLQCHVVRTTALVASCVLLNLRTRAGCAASWQACRTSWPLQGWQRRSRVRRGMMPPPAQRRRRSCDSSWTRPGVHLRPCLVVCQPVSAAWGASFVSSCRRTQLHWRAMSLAPALEARPTELRLCTSLLSNDGVMGSALHQESIGVCECKQGPVGGAAGGPGSGAAADHGRRHRRPLPPQVPATKSNSCKPWTSALHPRQHSVNDPEACSQAQFSRAQQTLQFCMCQAGGCPSHSSSYTD